jgi:hypothetical protein
MWQALEHQFEGIGKKLELLVWLVVFEEKWEVAI